MHQLKKINEQSMLKVFIPAICLVYIFIFASCDTNIKTNVVEQQDLFRLQYGTFENEIQLFNLHTSGKINTSLTMKDGFFYIANGEAGKIMQLTSYGDLVGLIYNSAKNPVPSFIDFDESTLSSAVENRTEISTQAVVVYPFNDLGAITVDSNKNLYVVDFLPSNRFELDEDTGVWLRQVVLRFAPDGTFIDYLGQEGPGGLPFPYIKALHTTNNNELVVICGTETGYIAYWFSSDGFLAYQIPIEQALLPPHPSNEDTGIYLAFEQVIPDYEERVLYIKIDYYKTEIDESTKVQSGISFDQTLIYPLDVTSRIYGDPISIPSFEKNITDGYTTEVYSQPYDFLGLTESGWLFFIIADETGFSILITEEDGQRIVRRHIDLPFEELVFHDFSLSNTGILSVFMAEEDHTSVSWWRTDVILDTIMQ